jgi:hypothetical protein
MMFDAPAEVRFPVNGGAAERGVIALSAAYVSLFGFVLLAPLSRVADWAAGSLL